MLLSILDGQMYKYSFASHKKTYFLTRRPVILACPLALSHHCTFFSSRVYLPISSWCHFKPTCKLCAIGGVILQKLIILELLSFRDRFCHVLETIIFSIYLVKQQPLLFSKNVFSHNFSTVTFLTSIVFLKN